MLVDLRTGKVWQLNSTGLALWKLLDGRHSLGDAVAELNKSLNVDLERLSRDVGALAAELLAAGLILEET